MPHAFISDMEVRGIPVFSLIKASPSRCQAANLKNQQTQQMMLYILNKHPIFPPPTRALPSGLLAVGGDLSRGRLLQAYRMGIFPWFNQDELIQWWSPDPRCVLLPEEFHISRRLKRFIRQRPFRLTMDRAFSDVIRACARHHETYDGGTWITTRMSRAYEDLHDIGFAHSVECWQGDALVGGLYGVSIGRCFCGESMFSFTDNASKVALIALVHQLRRWNFDFIDCQVNNHHMDQFGPREISRSRFLHILRQTLRHPAHRGTWHLDPDLAAAKFI